MDSFINEVRETISRYSRLRNVSTPSRIEENLKHLRINESGTLELDLENEEVASKIMSDIERIYQIDTFIHQT